MAVDRHTGPHTGAKENLPLGLLMREIFRRHGLPKQIVSDRGSIFTSAFFAKVCELLGVKQCLSTA